MDIAKMFYDYKVKAQILVDTGVLYKEYTNKLLKFINFIEHNNVWTEDTIWQYEGYINKIDSLLKDIDPNIINKSTTKINYELGILKTESCIDKINKHFEELMKGFE